MSAVDDIIKGIDGRIKKEDLKADHIDILMMTLIRSLRSQTAELVEYMLKIDPGGQAPAKLAENIRSNLALGRFVEDAWVEHHGGMDNAIEYAKQVMRDFPVNEGSEKAKAEMVSSFPPRKDQIH